MAHTHTSTDPRVRAAAYRVAASIDSRVDGRSTIHRRESMIGSGLAVIGSDPDTFRGIIRTIRSATRGYIGIDPSDIIDRTIDRLAGRIGRGLVGPMVDPDRSGSDPAGRVDWSDYWSMVAVALAADPSIYIDRDPRTDDGRGSTRAVDMGRRMIHRPTRNESIRVAAKLPTGRGSMPSTDGAERVEGSPDWSYWVGMVDPQSERSAFPNLTPGGRQSTGAVADRSPGPEDRVIGGSLVDRMALVAADDPTGRDRDVLAAAMVATYPGRRSDDGSVRYVIRWADGRSSDRLAATDVLVDMAVDRGVDPDRRSRSALRRVIDRLVDTAGSIDDYRDPWTPTVIRPVIGWSAPTVGSVPVGPPTPDSTSARRSIDGRGNVGISRPIGSDPSTYWSSPDGPSAVDPDRAAVVRSIIDGADPDDPTVADRLAAGRDPIDSRTPTPIDSGMAHPDPIPVDQSTGWVDPTIDPWSTIDHIDSRVDWSGVDWQSPRVIPMGVTVDPASID